MPRNTAADRRRQNVMLAGLAVLGVVALGTSVVKAVPPTPADERDNAPVAAVRLAGPPSATATAHEVTQRASASSCGFGFEGINPIWRNCTRHHELIMVHWASNSNPGGAQQGDVRYCITHSGVTYLSGVTVMVGFPVLALKIADSC